MAEVTRVLGNLQLDTEGGLVRASGTEPIGVIPSRHHSSLVMDDPSAASATKAGSKMAVAKNKVVGCFTGEISLTKADEAAGSFTGEIGVTKADAGNKEAAGCFTGEIGVTKAGAGNKEAAGSFTGEIGVTKADAGNKEAARSFAGEIRVTKAGAGNKEAARSFAGEIGVTKADAGNKEAAGSFAGEIRLTKADAGHKEAAGSITGDINFIKAEVGAAGKSVVTEADWIVFVFPIKTPEELLEAKAEPTGAMITKEMVPKIIIDRLKKRRPFKKLPPLSNWSGVYDKFPELRKLTLANIARWNCLVDLHENVVEQDAEKGFAEVGVDFTDGIKKIFVLPKDQGSASVE